MAKAYRISPARVLDRANRPAYKAAVYLLRRAANLPLAEVAERAGVSPARVSQIQTEIERHELTGTLKALMQSYKVKA